MTARKPRNSFVVEVRCIVDWHSEELEHRTLGEHLKCETRGVDRRRVEGRVARATAEWTALRPILFERRPS